MASYQRRRPDMVAVACLMLAAIVVSRSILRGGALTYLDNPVHLAEIYSLARGERWSDIGFFGFPLATLHSPLCYGLLARLSALGVPVEPLYTVALLAGFTAPALALYAVARRHLSPARAGLLAFALLVEPTAIVGVGAALGGMWTYFVGVALFILLADRIDRAANTPGQLKHVALLLGLIGLIHAFALAAAALLIATSMLRHAVARRVTVRRTLQLAGAGAAAALASAAYWYPLLTTSTSDLSDQQTLSLDRLLIALLLPSDTIHLVAGHPGWGLRYELYLTDALPSLLLVGGGLAGAALRLRDAHAASLPRTGALYALLLFALLVVVHYTPLPFLGPNTWRLLVFVRVGLALSCISLLARVPRRAHASRRAAAVAPLAAMVAAIGLAYWYGRPLRYWETKNMSGALHELRQVWRWMEANTDESDGRVYVQDTFYSAPEYRSLNESHLLVLTSHEVGLPQAGAYYGVTPYATARWSRSEFNALFGGTAERLSLATLMHTSNSGLLLLYSPGGPTATPVAALPTFELGFAAGRFSVWRFSRHVNAWVEPRSAACTVDQVNYRPGDVSFRATCSEAGGEVVVKTAWHAWWNIVSPGSAELGRTETDLISVRGLARGTQTITLRWAQPPVPWVASAAGWLCIALWWGIAWRRTTAERRATAQARSEPPKHGERAQGGDSEPAPQLER